MVNGIFFNTISNPSSFQYRSDTNTIILCFKQYYYDIVKKKGLKVLGAEIGDAPVRESFFLQNNIYSTNCRVK